MKIEQLPAEFIAALPVLEQIEAAGFEAYFVGGCVRDTLLGKPLHDIDIATSAYPSEIKAIFKKTVDTGIEHGTVMILDHGQGYETTTFRTESGYQDYRRPDEVTFVRSLAEDLKRRDFTINALAMDPRGEVIDLFDGIADLKAGLLQAVGDANERFNEDALRMMRAVRFASQLNFTIAPATIAGLEQNAPLLSKIAVERIQVEFEKLMLGQQPVTALKLMAQTGLLTAAPVLAAIAPGLNQLMTTVTWPLTTPATVWTAVAVTNGWDHQQINAELKAWKLSNDLIKLVQAQRAYYQAATTGTVDAMISFAASEVIIRGASAVAQLLGQPFDETAALQQYRDLPIHNQRELAVNGGQLIQAGLQPGPALGQTLQRLLTAVVTGELTNDAKQLIQAATADKEQ